MLQANPLNQHTACFIGLLRGGGSKGRGFPNLPQSSLGILQMFVETKLKKRHAFVGVSAACVLRCFFVEWDET